MDDSATISTKTYLQHSAYLANLGAYYLSNGHDQLAFNAYKKALGILQELANTDNINFEAASPSFGNTPSKPAVAIPFDFEGKPFSSITAEEESKSSYFVFSKPFVFNAETSLDVSCTPIYIAVVIFGMNLLLLRRARMEADNKSLHKALRLYDMGLSILQGAPDHVDSSNVLLTMLNNKAHVCYCIHEFDEAHDVLEELSGSLQDTYAEESSTLSESELDGMILNSLVMSDPNRVAPAA